MRTSTTIAILVCFVTSASLAADAAREIDFTQVLKGPNGDDITNCLKVDSVSKECTQKEAVTLGDAATIALEATIEEDRNADGKVKFERDQLARKIYKNAHAVLPPEDIATIKQRIGKVFGPAQVGATWPLLDPTLAQPVK